MKYRPTKRVLRSVTVVGKIGGKGRPNSFEAGVKAVDGEW